ncbi:MAG TPA: M24 family metallopeptidase [Nitrososphaerales archaeon]|nr:M24 family metallopeptidase [Nitrososphaerales archaeon]
MSLAVAAVGFDGKRAAGLIKERGLGGVLFTSPENTFYTTGAHTLPGTGNPILYALRNQTPTYSFVDAEGRVTLFTWMGATMGLTYEGQEVRTFVDTLGAEEELASFLGELQGIKRLGVESTCPFWAYRVVERAVGGENISVADEVALKLRLVKTAKELERIRASTRIVEATVSELAPRLHVGLSRLDLAQEARQAMMKHGATAVDHLTIAFGSSNPEVMLDEKLARDQVVTLDLGAVYEGYTSDNRRLFYTSEALPDDMAALHGKLLGIVDGVGEGLAPGTPFSGLYSRGVELYQKEGLEPMFFHVGHSIGIQTEEAWISAESELKVEENMVLNIELYAPHVSGVMIGDEETFVIEKAGGKRITTLPREIRLVGA